jgi:hypothetical protein
MGCDSLQDTARKFDSHGGTEPGEGVTAVTAMAIRALGPSAVPEKTFSLHLSAERRLLHLGRLQDRTLPMRIALESFARLWRFSELLIIIFISYEAVQGRSGWARLRH